MLVIGHLDNEHWFLYHSSSSLSLSQIVVTRSWLAITDFKSSRKNQAAKVPPTALLIILFMFGVSIIMPRATFLEPGSRCRLPGKPIHCIESDNRVGGFLPVTRSKTTLVQPG